jgi:hypothetical protein
MSVTGLNTYEVVKTLRAAGFSEEQAEAVTRVVRNSPNLDLSSLATKTDLAEVVAKLRIEMLEARTDIIKWVYVIGFAHAAFVVGMLRFTH